MGGCSCENECEIILPRTLVLVGKTGNGKSSTGNSILGLNLLRSKKSSSGVTVSSELQATTLEDGQMISVIDTPGLFDSSLEFAFIAKEIVKCISMAPDGVDAFLLVVSTNRFSEEEKAALSIMQSLFGSKVYDYMIVVFTRGDELEEEDQTIEDFLCDSPKSLKETLSLCGNRYVLFDNKTKYKSKRSDQVKKLLSLVNLLSTKNEGKLYTNEIFTEMKVELQLKETTLKLEQQLAKERAAFVKAEKEAKAAKKKSDDEKRKLKEKLEKAEKEAKAAKKKSDDEKRKLKEKLEKAEKEAKAAKKKSEEEKRRIEAHWRQREEDHRRAMGGCFIL